MPRQYQQAESKALHGEQLDVTDHLYNLRCLCAGEPCEALVAFSL